MTGEPGREILRAEAESWVASGERALHDDGDLAVARERFLRAYAAAEQAAEPHLMAAAALGLGGLWVHEHRLVADAAGIEARQRAALALLDPRSSPALRLRARLAAEADYRSGGHATIMRVVDEARRAGDPVALAEALSLAHHCLLAPDHARTRLELAKELLRAGSETGRPGDVLMGLLWWTVDLFGLGDPHAERSFAELTATTQYQRHAAVGFVGSAVRVMLSIRRGRLEEAEQLARECAKRGEESGDFDQVGFYAAQMVAIRWYQGRIGQEAETLAAVANSPTLSVMDNSFLAAVAVSAAAAGDTRGAAGALARIRGGDLARLPRSSSWLPAVNGVVEAAALLGDAETAAEAYTLLLPYAHLPVMGSLGVVCFGSVQHALGVASATTGDHTRAAGHFRDSIEHNTALGHWPAVVLSRQRLAHALAALGDDGAAEVELAKAVQDAESMGMVLPARITTSSAPVVLHRSGRRWHIELGGRTAVVDDSVGMRYLATLIANPGTEIPATDLTESPGSPGPRVGSAQPLLDEQAQRQYGSRLRELREEVEEAEAAHDTEQAARLREEADWLADELHAARGLAGRTRAFTDDAERARVAVRKAIRRALDRLGAADAEIGAHLRAAVHTGTWCSYRP